MGQFTVNTEGLPFSLPYTVDSGQSFRWTEKGGWWYGVVAEGVVKVRQDGASLVCSSSAESLDANNLFHYFGLEEDLDIILASIMKDARVSEAVQALYGLRVMKQGVWECLLSFAIATNSNIPRIKGMVSNLCQAFGEAVDFEGERFWLFPRPEAIADATLGELADCGLGYRAKFVKSIAASVVHGKVNLQELRLHDYPRARDLLLEEVLGKKTLTGIGPKVADCVLLFSCDKNSAFPIDVWMARVLLRYYPRLFDRELAARLASHLSGSARLSGGAYEKISASMREYFGEYAGYAQQYLFHDARKSKLE